MNKRITELRTEILGMTMEEFGEHIGVSRSSISLIESGSRNITERNIKAICKEFGVREDWLRTGRGNPLLSSEIAEIEALVTKYDLSDLDRIILTKWMGLSAAQRKVLDDFIADIFKEYIEAVPVAPQKPLDPATATKEEKMAAYEKYLDEREKAEGESRASNS